jgi:ATP-dependent DNA helicase RecG
MQFLHARKTSINERQKRVRAIEYLRTHKTITRSQYVKLVGCSKQSAFRDLDSLLKKGIIKKEGKGKRTCYILI